MLFEVELTEAGGWSAILRMLRVASVITGVASSQRVTQ